MDAKERKRIEKIAKNVRMWAVKNRGSFPPDLEGMCARAAGELLYRLQRAKIKAEIAFKTFHAFVRYDGYVIDVTATQFGMSEVEIVPQKEAEKHYFWSNRDIDGTFSSPWTAARYQARVGWPDDQQIRVKG